MIVTLKSAPIKGKANKELIKLIKKRINLPDTEIYIIAGHQNRDKIIQIVLKNQIINENFILKRLLK